ncbi:MULTISPECIES: FAD-dependent monooxygenase [Streptomyces]|uniref:FAD-dependent monooxygenase n=2 Tax=Streptomyces TaxID=1883 RepID=A0ABD5JPL4_9ACTN|nr:FAD-dependent monooxygenase [Streptomyces sp. WAC05858]MEE4590005.1 FAD-dependent monooxygenase [Streptomyces sp. DSM 41602]RSS37079.1 oxidoreductase [Streptomyces sp. WAC05858]WTA78601.1 FAD-dependent monooxygenase [Streptomyces antimycoticus]WTB02850.1 FAD-dependent monooxygenase [Streptomyces antimycoticus]
MSERQVAVIGGGPGGLYAAALIGLTCPDHEVTVYEHNTDGQTFGFGVGLTASTLSSLDAADPVSAAAIRRTGHLGRGLDMRVGAGVVLDGGDNIAIGRASLLEILRQRALEAGARIENAHVEVSDLDADLVIAADGVRSATREKLAAEFAARVDLDDALYLWAGADFALDRATFLPARTPHGVFVVHAYPYGPNRSTFLVETDDATWRRAGLQTTDARTPGGSSDEESLDYLSEVFAHVLGGRRLLGNRTRWQRFATISCGRWRHNGVVLLGDAAHTAHYSIGSGTKLAMEDAIALAAALRDETDDATALARYESERRPRVERFQRIAEHSHTWWKVFPRRLDLAPATIMSSFMTRAGNITVDGFATLHPDVVADATEVLTGSRPSNAQAGEPDALADLVLEDRTVTELSSDTAIVPTGPIADVWGADGAAVVERARGLQARALWLEDRDATARADVLSRCALAERLRLDLGATVGVDVPQSARADAVGALLAGRVDLVRFR